jgi:hypothetical protein
MMTHSAASACSSQPTRCRVTGSLSDCSSSSSRVT